VKSWIELSKLLFDSTMQESGVFHLYGHSWEIDELGLWNDLEKILDYICNRKNVLYLPNSEALAHRTARRLLPVRNHCAIEG
jgi:hypothetical protein